MFTKRKDDRSIISKLTIFASAFGIGSAGEDIRKEFEESVRRTEERMAISRIALKEGERAIAEAERLLRKN